MVLLSLSTIFSVCICSVSGGATTYFRFRLETRLDLVALVGPISEQQQYFQVKSSSRELRYQLSDNPPSLCLPEKKGAFSHSPLLPFVDKSQESESGKERNGSLSSAAAASSAS